MKDNSFKIKYKEKGNSLGILERYMKEILQILKEQVKVYFIILMVISIQDHLWILKNMDKEYISIIMEINMMEIGLMILRKDMGYLHLQVELDIMENLLIINKMEKECINM